MNEPGDIPTISHDPEPSGQLVWFEDGVEKPFEDANAENQHTWLEDSAVWNVADKAGDDEGSDSDDDEGIVWL